MGQKAIDKLATNLDSALDTFNWPIVNQICNEIVLRIRKGKKELTESSAKKLMSSLRRKRRFVEMAELAEAFLQSGQRTPQIRRQYAQALIDQNLLTAGELVLQKIINDTGVEAAEELEARGLTGRIYKQIYINNADPASPANRASLERAIQEYLYVYRLSPSTHLWHGINVVALAERARRDGLSLAGLPQTESLAKEILSALSKSPGKRKQKRSAYDVATEMEAYLALGKYAKAIKSAAKYVEMKDADAFELNSTLRQLVDVWQLSADVPPGKHLLPILKAGHLKREGASTEPGTPANVKDEAADLEDAMTDLEAILGSDRMVTLLWYKKGLDQCNSVARVERPDGSPVGTAWLVNAADFFPGQGGELLLTNNHVVSDEDVPVRNRRAIHPSDAKMNFQALGKNERLDVESEAVWKSPVSELDATFLRLKGDSPAPPIKIYDRELQLNEPPPRVYIIGHPQGRNLELSLYDNFLLAFNERLVHYRTPTEPGNSGSPVFEEEDWRAIALHHRGSKTMPRLDDPSVQYPANEGISMRALKAATSRP